MIKYIDLFSGVGGFRKALTDVAKNKRLHTRCVGFSEIDKDAIKTYRANFRADRGELELGDISKIKTSDLPDFDLLFAGFPCQPFSIMGKQDGFTDKRGELFFDLARVIGDKQPRFFILENVRGLFTMQGGEVYKRILSILQLKLGYHISVFILNSRDYGVPQTRRRLYILGFKNREDSMLNPPPVVDLKETQWPTVWHLLERKVDDKYYLSERLKKTILMNGSGNFKAKSEANQLIARPLSATMHKMHRACQDNYYSDRFIFGKYDKNKEEVILNKTMPDRLRRITPLEAFRLQGFEDSFVANAKRAGVSDTQLFRQAGNAVTVSTVKSVLLSANLNNFDR